MPSLLVTPSGRCGALVGVVLLAQGLLVSLGAVVVAEDAPEAVPLTRDDMKRALDASKEATPRLPAPPLTEGEKELIAWQKAEFEKGDKAIRRFGLANNGRMRAYYLKDYGFDLAEDLERARAGTNRNSNSGLDPNLRTAMFWIVSRGNNCTYCLGHQESSLASRGMSEDQLAALDHDWSVFDAAHQAAFAFARKLSFEPYAVTADDLAPLREHFTDEQVTEIVIAVAGFNATNRWTGPLRVQQDVLFPFVRTTSPKFASLISPLAPTNTRGAEQGLAAPAPRSRPTLKSREDAKSAIEAARQREARLPLLTEDAVREDFGMKQDAAVPNWIRLLAAVPRGGVERIKAYQAVLDKGALDPRTRTIIAYVGARHDEAWYALGHAIIRLRALGLSEDEIFGLDDAESLSSPADRAVVRFARIITVDPALVTDGDFETLRQLFGDRGTAEILYHITQAAFFNRLTEAAGLPLEP